MEKMLAKDLPDGYFYCEKIDSYGIKHKNIMYYNDSSYLETYNCIEQYCCTNPTRLIYDRVMDFSGKEIYKLKLDLQEVVKDYPLLAKICKQLYPTEMGFVPASQIENQTVVEMCIGGLLYIKLNNVLWGIGHTNKISDMQTMVKKWQEPTG